MGGAADASPFLVTHFGCVFPSGLAEFDNWTLSGQCPHTRLVGEGEKKKKKDGLPLVGIGCGVRGPGARGSAERMRSRCGLGVDSVRMLPALAFQSSCSQFLSPLLDTRGENGVGRGLWGRVCLGLGCSTERMRSRCGGLSVGAARMLTSSFSFSLQGVGPKFLSSLSPRSKKRAHFVGVLGAPCGKGCGRVWVGFSE